MSQFEILDSSSFENEPRRPKLPPCDGMSVGGIECKNRASITILNKNFCKNHAGNALLKLLIEGRLTIEGEFE